MQIQRLAPRIAIACGGTGGHLFPGVAVAEELQTRGCVVTLLISPKEIDQQAVKSAEGMNIEILPAVGLSRGKFFAFTSGFAKSYLTARKIFKAEKPEAILAMGGFTAAPPVLAGRACGAPTFLHESNSIPGKANRWLSRVITRAFVGFPESAAKLHADEVKITGTPVRPLFQETDPAICRTSLGFDPTKPVLLVTGGSQGASGLNKLVLSALPHLAKRLPDLQLLHLTGPNDGQAVQAACASLGIKAVVKPFFADMPLALGAATIAISRAGASSLAEMAAMRLPVILVPLPTAADNHQFYNAAAFENTGAAILIQQSVSGDVLAEKVLTLLGDAVACEKMRDAIGKWHSPYAAEQIAESIMQTIASRRAVSGKISAPETQTLENRHSAIM